MRICTRSAASRLDSGSSNRNTFGSRTMARPMATRWRWPPESCVGLRVEQLARCCRISAARWHPPLDLGLGRCPPCRRPKRDVLARRSCADRARRTGTPSRCRGRPAATSLTGSPSIAELAVADVLEAGDHAQQGRLAAARRPDEDDELAVLDVEVDAIDDLQISEVIRKLSLYTTVKERPRRVNGLSVNHLLCGA